MARAKRSVAARQADAFKNSRKNSNSSRKVSNARRTTSKNTTCSAKSRKVIARNKTVESAAKGQAISTELAEQYAALLRKCGETRDLSQGEVLHQHIRQAGFETDRYLGNHLLQMYGKCGAINNASLVFAHMPNKNIFSWNLMMGAFVDNGLYRAALKTFQRLLALLVLPDEVTFVSALTACSGLLSLAEGKWMHAYISRHGFASDTLVGTALLNLYAKSGSLDEAWSVFDGLAIRDSIAWNSLIVASAQNNRGKEAMQYFHGMQVESVLPTEVTVASILDACASSAALREGNRAHARFACGTFAIDVAIETALVNMYARCGKIDIAESIFNKMPEQNLVSLSAMIAAYAQHGHPVKVLNVARKIQHANLIPNEVTLVSILTACSHAGLIDEARYWFRAMMNEFGISPAEEHYNCMIDMLGRMGRLDEGEELLRNLPPCCSALPWLTLLGACKMHSDVKRARWAAEKVMHLDPGSAAPYVQLSNIYCEAGMWEEAESVRKMMENRKMRQQ